VVRKSSVYEAETCSERRRSSSSTSSSTSSNKSDMPLLLLKKARKRKHPQDITQKDRSVTEAYIYIHERECKKKEVSDVGRRH